ncbi:hypothetical protein DICPUDRAFT_81755 [Dictyostelium purpureum]|uniref:Uncharacterized protein n=1 Tax=Dictyostelium purpureum TaxID=5786 RepID=F0ZUH1_DICPU|nr:uncharacterized protein DICPUDRAFT_81755 [Dictyostelium purpureum]EGC32414.1 hypothetical protein DICPUDRAFT_81755 [Dictyostelium purpureum]|eukprot:XP_003291061.1 hypothetical protein DICPUDRAFT_81755 [Dictyostelium purpureum]
MEPKDLILNVIGSLYDIVKCCYGINGQYQMLVGEEDNGEDKNNVILSKKASEILKSLKIEHVFSNTVKKSVHMLETICYDCTNTLVLLIYSLFRECVVIMEKGIHPISLVYSLQNSFTTQIEPILKSLRIPLIPSLENIDTIDNDEILKLKLNQINLDLLYKTIYSIINTKLDNSTVLNYSGDNNDNDDSNNNNDNIVVSNIAGLCLETIKSLYINNKDFTIKDIMNHRISFQDQVIIYPRLLKNNDLFDLNIISKFLSNGFILDNNNSNNNNNLNNFKNNYSGSTNFILFINEDLKLKSNNSDAPQSGLTKSSGQDKKEKTKLVFHSAQERTELLEYEKTILKNKVFKICKYIEKIVELDNSSAAMIVLVFNSIDEYSKSLFDTNSTNSSKFLIFDNINQQHIRIINKSLGINCINSVDSIFSKEGLENKEYLLKIKRNFIGGCSKIQYRVFTNQFEFSKLVNPVSPLISVEIFAPSNHILRQRVGSFVTGMGIGKCCLEDLFILPSASSPEFSIIGSLKRQIESKKLSFVDQQTFEALVKSIETIPITLLSNQNKPVLKILDLFYKTLNNNNQEAAAVGINLISVDSDSDGDNKQYFINPSDFGIFETYRGKTQVFRFAIDIVCLLLKIDQIIQPQPPLQQKQQQPPPQQNQQQTQQKKEYTEFKTPDIITDAIEKDKIEKTKKQNEIFYSKEEIEKRKRLDRKFNTNPFNK